MYNRRLENGIIKAFCDFTKETEVPAIYALWCAVSTVSAMLGRRCFIDMGHYTVYPNTYIVLIAGSGKCKKSTSIGIAERFLKKVEHKPRIFSQKATPEALIGALSAMSVSKDEKIKPNAEGIIVADELSTFIDRTAHQTGMLQFLTTLWDSKDIFTYETRGRGKEVIRNSCVCMLGGSTIDWIKDAMSLSAVAGGLTARIIFVYRDSFERLILRTFMSEERLELEKNIVADLNAVGQMSGPFDATSEAWDFLNDEYMNFMRTSPMHDNRYLSGYANKRTSNLLKLCMIVSANRSDERVITLKDAATALNILSHAEKFMPRVLMSIASDESGVMNAFIFEIIEKKKKITRRQLLNLVHHRMQATQLDEVLRTLSEAGRIHISVSSAETVIKYIEDPEQATQTEDQDISFTSRVLKGDIRI